MSSSPMPSMHAFIAAEDGDIVQENNGVMSLVNMTTLASRRSSLSSSIEAVILNYAGEEEQNASDDRVDQLLADEAASSLETELAEERQKVATLTTERDALAEKSRDRETKIVELNNEIQKLHKQLEDMHLAKQTPQPQMEMKNSGQILFRMANFKAFAEGQGPKSVFTEPVVYINGLPWQIWVQYNNEWIGFFLKCNGGENDKAWNCRASCKLSVISSTKSDVCLKNFDHVFFATANNWGWDKFAKIEELKKNGFYDSEGDTITLKAEVIVKELKGMAAIRTEHTLLVNGKAVHVNKYLLAAHSTFFQNLFFGANAEAVPKVLIENDDEIDGMAHFERMISTMAPLNFDLDDECVAGVLLLANRFQLGFVVNRCVNFLLTKSKKSAIVKFRLAHECDIVGMKEKVLADMTKDDFAGENFIDNHMLLKKLGIEAVQEVTKRHRALFGSK